MRVLLLYPLFPKSFWSFDKALELIGRKVSLPPLSLITVAAILPQTWEFRLVDRNVGYESEADGNEANIHQTTLINFIPTRPLEEIAHEYIQCFWELYEPDRYLARVYRHFINMKPQQHKRKFKLPKLEDLRALFIICWRQGLKRNTRWQFWQQLFSIIRHNPDVFEHYLTNCAHLEHFVDYRQIVRKEIEKQLVDYRSTDLKTTELAKDTLFNNLSFIF